MSAPPVGGIGVRAEYQRHVVVLARVGDVEGNGHLGIEVRMARGVEDQPVGALLRRRQVADPAVVVGTALGDARPAVAVAAIQPDRHAARRPAPRGVQDMRGKAHAKSFLSLSSVILTSSAWTTARSVPGSLRRRSRSSASISAASRPLAQIRNPCPPRSSYATLPAAR